MLPPEITRKKLALWLNRGFIVDAGLTNGTPFYEAATTLGAAGEATLHEEDGSGDGGGQSNQDQLEAELRVCEQYVVGMLTNIGAQPAARILNMIKMFTPAEQEAPTEQNVQRLLAKMVEEGKLELSAGQYKLTQQ